MFTAGSVDTPATVLCLDAPDGIDDLGRSFADADHFETVSATTISDGRDVLDDREIDCVVSGFRFEDGTAAEFVPIVARTAEKIPYVLFSESLPRELARHGVGTNLVQYRSRAVPNATERLPPDLTDLLWTTPPAESRPLERIPTYPGATATGQSDTRRVCGSDG